MGKVVGLFLFEEEGAPPNAVETVYPASNGGFAGDRHGVRSGRKILAADAAALGSLGLSPGAVREQITIDGIPGLDSLPVGTRLRAGKAIFEVTKPCAPCLVIGEYNGVEDKEAFRAALEGKRGIFVMFVEPGAVSVGDEVSVVAQAASEIG